MNEATFFSAQVDDGTALIWASRKGRLGAVRTLLAAGADKEAKVAGSCEGGSVGFD